MSDGTSSGTGTSERVLEDDSNRFQFRMWLGVAAITGFAIALRLVPLHWSPLPATLDGFDYAALAEQTLATGHLATPIDWDEVGFTALLSVASTVTGVDPLFFAQPLSATLGGLSCLGVAAIAYRHTNSSRRRLDATHLVVVVAAFGVAVEGLYVRRTGAPDEELLGLVLVPLLALAVDRWLRTQRVGWGVIATVFVAFLPPLHTLSSLIALLCIVALTALHAGRSNRGVLSGVGLGVAFAGYLTGYYLLADVTPGLELVYTDRLLAAPGLFVAWGIVLVVGVRWFVSASRRLRRFCATCVVASLFALLAVNAAKPVFPATVQTPRSLLLFVTPLAVPATLASWWGLDALDRRFGAVPLALFAAPATIIAYALTAGLTFEYYDTAIRTQTFLHVPVLVLAAVGAVAAFQRVERGTAGRRVVVSLLLGSLLVTTPLAFVTLDTMSGPRTTTPSEFAAAGFASRHVPGTWASDDPLTRLETIYFDGNGNASQRPTIAWLRGGRPPACPVVVDHSWTTSGAHLFPAPPEKLPSDAYWALVTQRNRIYMTGRTGGLSVVIPRTPIGPGCSIG